MNLTTTSSEEVAHGLLLIVHLKVYVDPGVPLNADVRLEGSITVPPEPLAMLHVPVPTTGAVAASVTLETPQVEKPV